MPPTTALALQEEVLPVLAALLVGDSDVGESEEVDVADGREFELVEATEGAVISVLLVWLSSTAAVTLKLSKSVTLRKAQAGIAVPSGTGRGNLRGDNYGINSAYSSSFWILKRHPQRARTLERESMSSLRSMMSI